MSSEINEIQLTFNQHAFEYEQAAKVQIEIGSRLFERLSFLKFQPRYILDLGCGTGFFTQQLRKKYPKATIVALDIAGKMLLQAQKKQGWRKSFSLLNADMHHLPFAAGCFDLIFANQVVHWSFALPTLFRELNRVMQQNGCLMFSTLGPDTFQELRKAWVGIDNYAHVNPFADMHDIGDYLLAEQFLDPVVDMEHLTVHYADMPRLLASIKSQGVKNIHQQRNKGLTTPRIWQQFINNFQQMATAEAKMPLTYEVIYGSAWKGQHHRGQAGMETFIPVSAIRRK